jgi:hypothetical protein
MKEAYLEAKKKGIMTETAGKTWLLEKELSHASWHFILHWNNAYCKLQLPRPQASSVVL